MRRFLPIIILFLLSFWAIKPLFNTGFFTVHDNVQVERVFEMGKALKDGQFPVRLVKDLGYGYGYPLFNFYAPLPYYVGGVFAFLGLGAVTATKIMFGLGIILSALTMFFWVKELFGKKAGLLSAVLYLYSPYHALDIFVRGAVGEFWAMGFLPLAFLGLYKAYKKETMKGVLIGCLGFTGVILSHNLTAFMLIPFVVIFVSIMLLTSPKKFYFLRPTFSMVIIGLFISAFYWLPALTEMKYTNVYSQVGGGADFHNHFINLDQIWDFPWGFGGSAGRESGISYKIGKLNIVFSILALFLFLFNYKKYEKYKSAILLGIIGFLLAVFLTNQYSILVWDIVGPMSFIQYPWRFLIYATLFSSFLAGFVIVFLNTRLKGKVVNVIVVTIIFVLIFFQTKYFIPQRYTGLDSNYYTDINHLRWEASIISDEYLPVGFPIPKNKNELSQTGIKSNPELLISNVMEKTGKLNFTTDGKTFSTISILVTNFPGWEVKVDKQPISLATSPFLTFTVGAGKHEIAAYFKNTPVRSLANLISLFGVLIIGAILVKKKNEKSS